MTKAKTVTLSDEERAILDCLDGTTFPDEMYVPFRAIENRTGIPRHRVRNTCRRLARYGLAEYRKGLESEDGEFRGAGYAITHSGECILKALQAMQDLKLYGVYLKPTGGE